MAEISVAIENHKPIEAVPRERTPNIHDQRYKRFWFQGQRARKVYGRPRHAIRDGRRYHDFIAFLLQIGRSSLCVYLRGKRIEAQRQVRAVLLHHANRQNHERTTGTCYAFNIWKWDLCEVLHSYSLTAMSTRYSRIFFSPRIARLECSFQPCFCNRPIFNFGWPKGTT